jgi:hypothetical protein
MPHFIFGEGIRNGLKLNGAIVGSLMFFYPTNQTGRQDTYTTTIAAML